MALRHAIGDVTAVSDGIWRGKLTPADIRRIGETDSSIGSRSVVGVMNAHFDAEASLLSTDPDATIVLNIGATDEVLLLDLGRNDLPQTRARRPIDALSNKEEAVRPTGRGDKAFLTECKRHLDAKMFEMAERLLSELRGRYPGNLHEGLARKWVNRPGNFLALTIQNRDQSLAVHVKGEPKRFNAPTLAIKPDRGSYSRFKLKHPRQFDDALRVILASAKASEGY